MVFQLSHGTEARQDNKGALRAGHAERTRIGEEAVADSHQLSHHAKWDTAEDTCRGGRGGASRPGRGANVAACKSLGGSYALSLFRVTLREIARARVHPLVLSRNSNICR